MSFSNASFCRKATNNIALLAIEGERDDVCGVGQTTDALKIATKLPKAHKKYHLAPEVGHYDIFNGSKWRDNIAPVAEDIFDGRKFYRDDAGRTRIIR